MNISEDQYGCGELSQAHAAALSKRLGIFDESIPEDNCKGYDWL